MIVGIEQTTDARHPETLILKFTSEARARAWLDDSGAFAWPGAADESLPVTQQNFHRRTRTLYGMPHAYRLAEGEIRRQWQASRSREGLPDLRATRYARDAARMLFDAGGQWEHRRSFDGAG